MIRHRTEEKETKELCFYEVKHSNDKGAIRIVAVVCCFFCEPPNRVKIHLLACSSALRPGLVKL